VGGRLVILEQQFPGWRVRIDGGGWTTPQNEDGFMSTPLPPGRHRVEFRYGLRTPARISGIGVSLLTLLACTVPLRRGLRKSP
jgi:hypothetical protein